MNNYKVTFCNRKFQKKTKIKVMQLVSALIAICLFMQSGLFPFMQIQASPITIDQEVTKKIEKYVLENNPVNAAVAVSVVGSEKVQYHESFGFANKKEQIKADENTIYEWGSLTKVLTWISIMQLVEQGKIDLNEDIRTYLPDHYLKKLKFEKPVTVLDLMNHTGGWQDSITNVYTNHPTEILPLEKYVQKYEPVQIYEPGSTVAYSNWSTTLAGYIVERVSNETYCDYVNNHIFHTLGMKHSSIDPLRKDNEFVRKGMECITGYTTSGKELKGRFYAPDYAAAGAAGTSGDVELLMQALLGSNKLTLFEKPETLQTMLETTYEFQNNTTGESYPENAHGLWYDFYTTPALGHYGNTVQFSVHMSISPQTNTGVLVMTNQAQEMALNHGLAEIIFGDGKSGIDHEAFKTVNPSDRIYQFHKFYTGARTIERGCCRFYHSIQIYQAKMTNADTLILTSLGMQMTCKKVSDKVYRCESGFTEGYYFFLTVDDNNVVQKISTSVFDMIPYSSVTVVLDLISFILIAVAFITIWIILIYSVIQILKKKSHYKSVLVMNLLSFGYYIMVVLESMKTITTAATTNDIIPYIISYIIYILAAAVNLVLYLRDQQKNLAKTLTLLSSLIIVFFILHWQMIFIW